MKYCYCIILSILILATSNVVSQESSDFNSTISFNNRIGVTLGSSMLYGISYRHYFNNIGVQSNYFCIFRPSKNTYGSYSYSFHTASISLFYNYLKTERIDYFVYQSAPFFARIDEYGRKRFGYGVLSFGTGIEFFPDNRYSINLMQGILFSFPEQIVSMTFELGFYYCF